MSGLLTRGSFRRQLVVTLTLGIVVLTLSGSVFTTWLITDRLKSLVISQTVQLTGQFADSSILIFLVQDKSLARRQLGMMRSFPGVITSLFWIWTTLLSSLRENRRNGKSKLITLTGNRDLRLPAKTIRIGIL